MISVKELADETYEVDYSETYGVSPDKLHVPFLFTTALVRDMSSQKAMKPEEQRSTYAIYDRLLVCDLAKI